MLSEISDLFNDAIVSPPSDRRMSRRLLNVWARTARGRFPSWGDMRSIDLGEDWNWTFVVDVKKSVGFPYFVYLGQNLAKLSDVYLSGASDWTVSVLDRATDDIDATVIAEAPHTTENDLVLWDGRTLQFRALMAPLADDGEIITHVFGAASGRIIE